MNTNKWQHRSLADILVLIFMIYVVIITLYPFLNVTAKSFNDPIDTVKGGITIFPRVPTMNNYTGLFEAGSNLPAAFRMSVLRTLVGTVTGVLCCAMFAFTLSRRDFIFRSIFTVLLVITMYVGGGMIPDYILIRNLGLINSFWVYIIPGLINTFNVVVIRAYIDTIPLSLQESARIDGANDLSIFSGSSFPSANRFLLRWPCLSPSVNGTVGLIPICMHGGPERFLPFNLN